jgi:hypothetical protein
MRDDLPNQIHMALCAVIPLCIFAVLHIFFLPFGWAATLSIVSAIVIMLVAAPLTFWLYRFIRSRYGQIQNDAVVHTTDAGCSSIVFLIFFFFALYPLLARVVIRLLR